jgi:hypothetical protein
MNDPQQQMIRDAMQAIAQRKPGKTKLVYDKTKRTIVAVAEGTQAPKAASAPAINPADHVQPASSLPPVPILAGGQVSRVRPDQSVVQPSNSAVEPSRFAQVVKALSTPHAFGARCPHDWVNWLSCPECNPPRR